jgi:hypothetical protein
LTTKKKTTRTDAQKKADKAYEAKRANRTQLSGYLDEAEAKLLEQAAKKFGSKKAGIIGALKFWKKYRNKV